MLEILKFLEAGFDGPEPRLGGKLRLRYCGLALSAGVSNVRSDVDPLANSTDHYLAPRAQIFAGISRLNAGEDLAALEYLSRAAAGPDEASAAKALQIAAHRGWTNRPEFRVVAAALAEQ